MDDPNLQYDENTGSMRDARKYPLEGTLREIINIIKKYNEMCSVYHIKENTWNITL